MTPTPQLPDNPETVADDLAKWNLEGYHAQALLEFMRLMRGNGSFSLILLQYNDLGYRDKVIPYLNRYASKPATLHVEPETDFPSFEQHLFSLAKAHDLVQVTGLNEWLLSGDRDAKFRGLNYHRERIAGEVKTALALWMTEFDISDLALKAPDMWAWRKGVLDFSLLDLSRDLLELSPLDLNSADRMQRGERIKEIEVWLAEHTEETISRANLLRELGRIQSELSDNDAALQTLEVAREIYRRQAYKRDYAVVLHDIAAVYLQKGDTEASLRLHREALELFRKLGDQRSEGGALKEIARIYNAQGLQEKSLDLYRKAVDIFTKIEDHGAMAATMGDIAQIHPVKGDPQKALQLLQQSQEIFNSLGDKNNYAKVLGIMARVYNKAGDQQKALSLFEEARDVFDTLGDKRSLAVVLTDIASLYESKGEVEKAINLHKESLSIFEGQGDAGAALPLFSLARLLVSKGELEKAPPLLRRAHDILKTAGRAHESLVLEADLGQVLCRLGDNREGIKMLRSAEAGLRKLGKDEQAAIVKKMIRTFRQPKKP